MTKVKLTASMVLSPDVRVGLTSDNHLIITQDVDKYYTFYVDTFNKPVTKADIDEFIRQLGALKSLL